jgi:hypothetical protein
LKRPQPVAIRALDVARPYGLHGLDLLLLKHCSKLVRGPDVRTKIAELDVTTEVRKALDHVLNQMVPRSLQAAEASGSGALAGTPLVAVATAMARCLYTLYEGCLASKSHALEWAADRFAGHPESNKLFRLLLACRLQGDETASRTEGGVAWFKAMLPRYREEVAGRRA